LGWGRRGFNAGLGLKALHRRLPEKSDQRLDVSEVKPVLTFRSEDFRSQSQLEGESRADRRDECSLTDSC